MTPCRLGTRTLLLTDRQPDDRQTKIQTDRLKSTVEVQQLDSREFM